MDEGSVNSTSKQSVPQEFSAVPFVGQDDALFERHLLSDAVVERTSSYERQRFEALAHSVRDLLAKRWIKTQQAYDQANPKRIYYMSMEFLIGRSLTNNVTNLLLHPFIERAALDGESGLVRPDRTGTGRRAWQWWPGKACCLLSQFDGDIATPGNGLRIALRVWHVPTVHRAGVAARTSRQLVAPTRSLGSIAPQRSC